MKKTTALNPSTVRSLLTKVGLEPLAKSDRRRYWDSDFTGVQLGYTNWEKTETQVEFYHGGRHTAPEVRRERTRQFVLSFWLIASETKAQDLGIFPAAYLDYHGMLQFALMTDDKAGKLTGINLKKVANGKTCDVREALDLVDDYYDKQIAASAGSKLETVRSKIQELETSLAALRAEEKDLQAKVGAR